MPGAQGSTGASGKDSYNDYDNDSERAPLLKGGPAAQQYQHRTYLTNSRPPQPQHKDSDEGDEPREEYDEEGYGDEGHRDDGHDHSTSFFFERVAETIQERDRKALQRNIVKGITFFWSILSCLSAGSITAYSLYAPLFQSHLHYNEFQVNIVSIAAEIGLYGVVPIFGFLCDRYGPALCSFLSAIFFGFGYLFAAFTYKSGAPRTNGGEDGWPFGVMVLAFFTIGMGTSAMYMGAVTTCAKNFARSKYKGFALAAPIASFGLSGMWQSQVGARLLYERDGDGVKTGDVDVFKYFLFLAGLLLFVGLVGSVALRIVDEEGLIDDAVEELERSGLLEDSAFFRRGSGRATLPNGHRYGTIDNESLRSGRTDSIDEADADGASSQWRSHPHKVKKTWLLNEETRRFLADPTLWFLAAGFFLVTGPGEAFINNLGTIIGTLYDDPASQIEGTVPHSAKTSPATHVSIVAFTSTVARLLCGTLSDLLGPTPVPLSQQTHVPRNLISASASHLINASRPATAHSAVSLSSLDPLAGGSSPRTRWRCSLPRPVLLLVSALVLSLGLALLASGAIQQHAGERFWLVSALVGTGYGAVFSLVPLIISCVWGVHNFATNWSIVAMVPALGATLWGAVYAWVYEMEESRQRQRRTILRLPRLFGVAGLAPTSPTASAARDDNAPVAGHCYGASCYRATFWSMAACVWLACLLWIWAWRGKGGWVRRGVRV